MNSARLGVERRTATTSSTRPTMEIVPNASTRDAGSLVVPSWATIPARMSPDNPANKPGRAGREPDPIFGEAFVDGRRPEKRLLESHCQAHMSLLDFEPPFHSGLGEVHPLMG